MAVMTGVTGIQRNKGNRLGHAHTTRWFVALDVSRGKPGNDGAEASGFDADGINRKTILFFTGFPSKLENDGAGRRRPPEGWGQGGRHQ